MDRDSLKTPASILMQRLIAGSTDREVWEFAQDFFSALDRLGDFKSACRSVRLPVTPLARRLARRDWWLRAASEYLPRHKSVVLLLNKEIRRDATDDPRVAECLRRARAYGPLPSTEQHLRRVIKNTK
jgi:hypothetical protein